MTAATRLKKDDLGQAKAGKAGCSTKKQLKEQVATYVKQQQVGHRTGHKKCTLERQSLSGLKMDRGLSICKKVCVHIDCLQIQNEQIFFMKR